MRLFLVAFLACAGAASAADPFPDRLTGSWGGTRSNLADRGVTVDLDWTQYYQGLVSGTGSKDWDYGGRLDAYAGFDTEKLGLWKGGAFRLHAEYFYGDLSPNLGGVVAPSNVGMRLPNPGTPEDLVFTNIALAQKIGDGGNLLVGKINTVDLIAADPFFGGGGVSRFLNLAFAAPPNGLLPPAIMGALLSVPAQEVGWTFMVYDPNDRTHDATSDLFGDGVNVSAGAKFSGHVAGRASSAAITGIYSTKDSVNLGEVLLPADLSTGNKSHSWHVSLQLAHYLTDSWGLFAKLGASDGNPNPYQGFFTGGVGGKGLFASRPEDSFGVGYFYYNLSDDLQSALNPVLQIDNEQGAEVYYDFAVARGIHFGLDLQYVDPAQAQYKNALIAGARLRFRL